MLAAVLEWSSRRSVVECAVDAADSLGFALGRRSDHVVAVEVLLAPLVRHLACGATIVHMQLRCPRHWYLGHTRVVRFLRNFDRLVLGCIEADVASKISNTHVAGVWGSTSFVQISEFFPGVYPFGSLTFAQL